MVDGLFLDLFGNRKQVWLIIGIAVGLAYLARRAEAADEDAAVAGAFNSRPPGNPDTDPPSARRRSTRPPGLVPRGQS
jgi:hypothetical protein